MRSEENGPYSRPPALMVQAPFMGGQTPAKAEQDIPRMVSAWLPRTTFKAERPATKQDAPMIARERFAQVVNAA
jgi:hypothetical protein